MSEFVHVGAGVLICGVIILTLLLEGFKMTEKPFLKIIDDYYIKYGDEGELFNLHKQSDIRILVYLINRDNGFSELQCEYNDLMCDD